MPPRAVVLAILAFWAVMTGVLFYQELLPHFGPVNPPAISIILTDEIGSSQANWTVHRKEESIGTCTTSIRRADDEKHPPAIPEPIEQLRDKYNIEQVFTFQKFDLAIFAVKKLTTEYRVTADGKLLKFKVVGTAEFKNGEAPERIQGNLVGAIEDGKIQPRLTLTWGALTMDGPTFDVVDVGDKGVVLNPMLLQHRLPDLRDGQTWRVPMFDPFRVFSFQGPLGKLPIPENRDKYLDAQVFVDKYHWRGRDVDCLRVDYWPPGKAIIARTWVRRSDSLVIAQEAKQGDVEFSIVRVPDDL